MCFHGDGGAECKGGGAGWRRGQKGGRVGSGAQGRDVGSLCYGMCQEKDGSKNGNREVSLGDRKLGHIPWGPRTFCLMSGAP